MSAVVFSANSATNMELLIALARKLYVDVMPLSRKEVEQIEDVKLLKMMENAKDEGKANRKRVLSKLDITV